MIHEDMVKAATSKDGSAARFRLCCDKWIRSEWRPADQLAKPARVFFNLLLNLADGTLIVWI